MSSFKTFQKNIQQLSRSNSHSDQQPEHNPGPAQMGSRMSYSREEQVDLDKVIINPNREVTFRIDSDALGRLITSEGRTFWLVGDRLQIRNLTGCKIYYKLATNAPEILDVRPNQDILPSGSQVEVAFRIKVEKKHLVSLSSEASGSYLRDLIGSVKAEVSWDEISSNQISSSIIPPLNHGASLQLRLVANMENGKLRPPSFNSQGISQTYNNANQNINYG